VEGRLFWIPEFGIGALFWIADLSMHFCLSSWRPAAGGWLGWATSRAEFCIQSKSTPLNARQRVHLRSEPVANNKQPQPTNRIVSGWGLTRVTQILKRLICHVKEGEPIMDHLESGLVNEC